MSEVLIAAVREAFPDVPPPGGPVVTHDCPECDGVSRLLQGRRWREVEDTFYRSDAFALLSPAARAYYLPGFLTLSLREPGTPWAGGSVAYALEDGGLSRDQFTAAQRVVILAWAHRYYNWDRAERREDLKAIEAHWLELG